MTVYTKCTCESNLDLNPAGVCAAQSKHRDREFMTGHSRRHRSNTSLSARLSYCVISDRVIWIPAAGQISDTSNVPSRSDFTQKPFHFCFLLQLVPLVKTKLHQHKGNRASLPTNGVVTITVTSDDLSNGE